MRDHAAWRVREWPFVALVFEPLHDSMETGLMRGLKERAEGAASVTGRVTGAVEAMTGSPPARDRSDAPG